jgi:hypothetical protein
MALNKRREVILDLAEIEVYAVLRGSRHLERALRKR